MIAAMMAPYIAKFGMNVYVGKLLDAAGLLLHDMLIPVDTRFASKDGSKGFLCRNSALGKCKFGRACKYKQNHPQLGDLPDVYAKKACTALTSVVTTIVATKNGSQQKKLKIELPSNA